MVNAVAISRRSDHGFTVEIFNAFKVVDEGLKNANSSLDHANAGLPAIINERAKKTKELEQYAERTGPAREYSKELSEYIEGLVEHMVDDAGDKNGVA